ncbi:MAG: class I SAM-dependent methyltransferase [Candidatus Aminicenantes bacterium]|nr:class I SAM-dependent methyltransferase [Candidatus Aminicenantes bacterium]
MTLRTKYYEAQLSGRRLMEVYEIAPPRVLQYLKAETEFVLDCLSPETTALDLGCGYGRIIPDLLKKADRVVGIDSSWDSLIAARAYLHGFQGFRLLAMDAGRMGFSAASFDAVICIQNGVSAFKVEPRTLFEEALRVTRRNGIALFSTYADSFWEHRLEWFRSQAERGLVGEIDEEQTRRGEIVCRDGFRATTFSPEHFRRLTRGLPAEVTIQEVDGSSLFCLLRPR